MTLLLDYFSQNHDSLLYVIAGLSMVIELTILGFTGFLMFFAIGTGITGLMITFGLISGWESELFSVGVTTIIAALLLWKPMKKFHDEKHVSDSSSDMIGLTVPVSETITTSSGSIRYSGINWQARLSRDCSCNEIAINKQAIIVQVNGSIMIVKETQ